MAIMMSMVMMKGLCHCHCHSPVVPPAALPAVHETGRGRRKGGHERRGQGGARRRRGRGIRCAEPVGWMTCKGVQGWGWGEAQMKVTDDKREKKDGEHDPELAVPSLIRSTPVYTRQLRSQSRPSRDAPLTHAVCNHLPCVLAQLK